MVSPLVKDYFNRMRGERYEPMKYSDGPSSPSRLVVITFSFIGAFVGISSVAALHYYANFFVERDFPVMAGSFGASAVLLYGAIESPLSQPRNVFGGHIMSALISVSFYKLFNLLSQEMFDKLHWLLCALSVSVSLMVMQLTHTVHPPASATALIAVTGGQTIYDLGYWYVLCPIALGVSMMVVVALLVNNIARRYPLHWWSPKAKRIMVVDQDMSKPIADFVSQEEEIDGEKHDNLSTNRQLSPSLQSSNTDLNSTIYRSSTSGISPPDTRRHSISQVAIYYGGERDEELKNGELMFQDLGRITSHTTDIEHGQPTRHSIRIETSNPTPTSSVHREEDPRLVIQKLQQRIHELEVQLAAHAK
ncbi:hypothetical protein BGZ76_000619 [Entomortierella beljakovae]|nr:hypothetical protein BGZ76_000619 [Entomortierella beljakovae]